MNGTRERVHEQLTAEARNELNELLARLESGEPSEQDEILAYRAARALGYCKLFGTGYIAFPERLPAPVAKRAVEAAVEQFKQYAVSAVQLPREWDEEGEPTLRDQLCLRRLHERTEAQAVYVAVVESLEAALEDEEIEDREYVDLVTRLSDALRDYDICLRSVAELLSTVHEDSTLELWRAGLTEPYRSLLPWWMGPELAQIAERTAREVDELLAGFAERAGSEPSGLVLVVPAILFRPARIAAKGERRRLSLKWYSPDRRYTALSWFEYPLDDEESMKLVFYDSRSGERATELRGYYAQLAGLLHTIGEDVQCSFKVADLRRQLETGEQVRLYVGPSPESLEAWHVDEEALKVVEDAVDRDSAAS